MYTEIGWFGMVTFLVAYALVALGKVQSTGIPYNLLNITGAASIAYSLLPAEAWPTITLEGCFILIGGLRHIQSSPQTLIYFGSNKHLATVRLGVFCMSSRP